MIMIICIQIFDITRVFRNPPFEKKVFNINLDSKLCNLDWSFPNIHTQKISQEGRKLIWWLCVHYILQKWKSIIIGSSGYHLCPESSTIFRIYFFLNVTQMTLHNHQEGPLENPVFFFSLLWEKYRLLSPIFPHVNDTYFFSSS